MRHSALLHPLHPVLAHFPLAFWIGSSAADLMALKTHGAVWWTVSHHALAAGTLMGALTLLAGGVELWLRKLPPAAVRWAVVHASLMATALVCFMVSLAWRTSAPPPLSAVALSLLGCVLLLMGGYCGGMLVYRFGVGVSWRAEESR